MAVAARGINQGIQRGLRFFEVQGGSNWSTSERVARAIIYPMAQLAGTSIHLGEKPEEMRELPPSRLKVLTPALLVGAAALYLGAQVVALIALVTWFAALSLSLFAMSRSQTQHELNEKYAQNACIQREAGLRHDRAKSGEEVKIHAQAFVEAAQKEGWLAGSGDKINAALATLEERCQEGITAIVRFLVEADQDTFDTFCDKTAEFFAGRMIDQDAAINIAAQVMSATPEVGHKEQITRFQQFVAKLSEKCSHIEELSSAVKGNPAALVGLFNGLIAKQGSLQGVVEQGLTRSVLEATIRALPLDTLGPLAVQLEDTAQKPGFDLYADLVEDCLDRMGPLIIKIPADPDYEGEPSPAAHAFLKLGNKGVQVMWLRAARFQDRRDRGWVDEVASRVGLEVGVNGLYTTNLAKIQPTFLTILLQRLLDAPVSEENKAAAAALIHRANTSTLEPAGLLQFQQSDPLAPEMIALIQALRVKYGLMDLGGNIQDAVLKAPRTYVPLLLALSEKIAGYDLAPLIWQTYAKGGNYPNPRVLADETSCAFYGNLPRVFKSTVTNIPVNLEMSAARLCGVLTFLVETDSEEALRAFCGALDAGQQAIIGHELLAEKESEEAEEARRALTDKIGTSTLEDWKSKGSVGASWLPWRSGYVE